ncbi:pentatricopeptide repeat-containing protein At2g36980, mitochondrial [Malania oleifera]|uniref:pentatricopeptide repeat-containing protein At2g36980, mitochondrial n=1 Tax=Malania oleifera TaxID=397392 RepID=UPI0025AD9D54|nr:pentatricopeptide repeat-containing protein At2g36980, mitochondrial [Malania oleifera]
MQTHPHLFHITSKITALSGSGRIACARKLFDELPHKDSVAWNAMLTGYSHLGLHQQALSLFHYMRISNVKPDHFSFTATLSASAGACNLSCGRKIHAQVIVYGCQSSLAVSNSLIDMYSKCLSPSSASRVFEEMSLHNEVSWCSLLFAYTNSSQFHIAREVFNAMPNRVDFAWNTMITSFARCGEIDLCLDLFKEMQQTPCRPDQWTFSALMNAYCESLDPCYGCTMHGYIVKSGWSSAAEVSNSILSFYAKQSCYNDAIKLFESTESLTQVSWNAIIDAHMKMGDTHKAFVAFNDTLEKNVVSWTSMITGYARNGQGEQALSFFVGMMRNNILPDDFTFGAVLHACSSLALLGHGKMAHGCIICYGFHNYVYVGNGLINMYAKCGDIVGSSYAFNDILDKDLVSWNAMFFALGLNGQAAHALRLYEEMISSGVKPDKMTFIGLLMTCSHSGLIEKGLELFESMQSLNGFSHEMDHVSCLVDMLGRGGHLKEARDLANIFTKTGVKTSSCETLLGACFAHGNVEIGTYLGEDLKILEPRKDIGYVLLSNLYCASGQWRHAQIVRKAMVDQRVKKQPGYSWIQMGNKVMTFVAGNHAQLYMVELGKMLYCLEFEMRSPSFIGSGIEGI